MSPLADLPDPATLRSRWATLALAFRSLGIDGIWTSEGAHYGYDDRGGNRLDLVVFDDGRAVLTAFDHEFSQPGDAATAFDGAPAWVPRDPVAPKWPIAEVTWFDESWHGAPRGRGLEVLTRPLTDPTRLATELATLVLEWGEYEPADDAEQTEITAAAGALATTGVTAETLAALLGRLPAFDPTRVGFARVAAPAPRKRPARLEPGDHDRVFRHALADEPEKPRPAPPVTPELEAFVAWLRRLIDPALGVVDSRVRGTAEVVMARFGVHEGLRDGTPKGQTFWDEFKRHGQAVREAEADPEHGRWLYFSVTVWPDRYEVERFYDSLPPWQPLRESTMMLSGAATELDRRSPEWVPSWSAVLDPAEAKRRLSTLPSA